MLDLSKLQPCLGLPVFLDGPRWILIVTKYEDGEYHFFCYLAFDDTQLSVHEQVMEKLYLPEATNIAFYISWHALVYASRVNI